MHFLEYIREVNQVINLYIKVNKSKSRLYWYKFIIVLTVFQIVLTVFNSFQIAKFKEVLKHYDTAGYDQRTVE